MLARCTRVIQQVTSEDKGRASKVDNGVYMETAALNRMFQMWRISDLLHSNRGPVSSSFVWCSVPHLFKQPWQLYILGVLFVHVRQH